MTCARWLLSTSAALLLSAGPLQAHEYYLPGFTLIHPWANPTPPDAAEAAVYFTLDSVSVEDRLLRGSTAYAEQVELRAGDDREAPAAASITVLAGDQPAFMPGGRPHLLLRGLKTPLQWGRSYAMTLVFEKAGPVAVMVSIGAH